METSSGKTDLFVACIEISLVFFVKNKGVSFPNSMDLMDATHKVVATKVSIAVQSKRPVPLACVFLLDFPSMLPQ